MSGKKFTAEERIQAARICAEGKISASKMSKKLGVRKSLVIEWIYRYKENGEEAFTETIVYSAELKRAAVEEYLCGGKSLYAVSAKYGIQSYSTLKRWIKAYNSGREFKQMPSGGSRMKTGRKTTQEERIIIAIECLENDCKSDFLLIALT